MSIEIFENKAQRKFGCLMVVFDIDDKSWQQVCDKINFANDVYDDGSGKYGTEKEPHVTVLYGLHDNEFSIDDLKSALPEIGRMTAILTGISCFEQPEYDVLKFDVDAPMFHSTNSGLRSKFPYTTDFPDYHPHLTLAYLNKGMGKKYMQHGMSIPLRPKQYKYGFADGRDDIFVK